MKNMIEPDKLALLRQKPVSYEGIASFLEGDTDITATQLCKLIDVDPQRYFNWKSQNSKKAMTGESGGDRLSVTPVGGDKKRYSADDKLKLVKLYSALQGPARAEFLRKFGLYQSDIDRWEGQVNEAALEALSKRKTRCDKKSDAQIELENLKKEMKGQEKTIAKLAALVVIQKKVSELLSVSDEE